MALDINEKINQAIDKDGIKVNVGIDPVTAILISVAVLFGVIIGGIILHLITKNL